MADKEAKDPKVTTSEPKKPKTGLNTQVVERPAQGPNTQYWGGDVYVR